MLCYVTKLEYHELSLYQRAPDFVAPNIAYALSFQYKEELISMGSTQFLQNASTLSFEHLFKSKLGRPHPYPSTYDIRKMFPQTPVQHQGKCGSCYAFASIVMIENIGALLAPLRWRRLHRGRVHLPGESLSVQSIVDCSSSKTNPDSFNNGCNGGNFKDTFKYVIKNGIVASSDYPYVAKVRVSFSIDCLIGKIMLNGASFSNLLQPKRNKRVKRTLPKIQSFSTRMGDFLRDLKRLK